MPQAGLLIPIACRSTCHLSADMQRLFAEDTAWRTPWMSRRSKWLTQEIFWSSGVSDTASDHAFMQRALEAARGAPDASTPIAALIVRDGVVLACQCNAVKETCDPTAHAEIQAIRAACRGLGDVDLGRATLYSTLEPCGMCTMAAIWSKIGRIVYGAGRADVHSMYFEDRHLHLPQFIGDAYRRDIDVRGGVLREACASLYHRPHAKPPMAERGNV
jgi:tRNA(adenine34) deaminase